jgi:acetyltransferase-like isoleucine patch superfamily enzyme
MLSFFAIFLGSFLIPSVIFFSFIMLFYLPNVLNESNIILLFTRFESLLGVVSIPFVIIFCYLLHIFMVGVITRSIWRFTEKRSPSKDGIIPRNVPSKTLNYYHIRSFLIKYPKNVVNKGPFPWLINWFYNFVGSNKIGKGTTIEEQFGADKFVEIGENSYVGVNSGFSSHAVEGIFGNVAYAKIKLGDNVTTAALNCLAPGVEIKDNAVLFPLAGATKYSSLKGDNYYYGVPLRRIFKRKVEKYSGLTEEHFQRAERRKFKSSK